MLLLKCLVELGIQTSSQPHRPSRQSASFDLLAFVLISLPLFWFPSLCSDLIFGFCLCFDLLPLFWPLAFVLISCLPQRPTRQNAYFAHRQAFLVLISWPGKTTRSRIFSTCTVLFGLFCSRINIQTKHPQPSYAPKATVLYFHWLACVNRWDRHINNTFWERERDVIHGVPDNMEILIKTTTENQYIQNILSSWTPLPLWHHFIFACFCTF